MVVVPANRHGLTLACALSLALLALAPPWGAAAGFASTLDDPHLGGVERAPARETSGYAEGAATPSTAITVLVDPRVELMSIVFRLAGNREYNRAEISGYAGDADAHFAAFKNHPAVEMARKLHGERGISYNAPMSLAVHATGIPELAERVSLDPRPEALDYRWTPEDARAFLSALRDFVRDANFQAFWEGHASLYRESAARLEGLLQEKAIAQWLDGYVGTRGTSRFVVIIGLLNGGSNYGASIRLADGSEEIYSVVGAWSVDETGVPLFDEGYIGTILHEFCHTYVNPLVDAHEAELRAAGEKMYPAVETWMRDQAYTNWKIMMYESIVRAVGVRYKAAHYGPEAASREVDYNRSAHFIWTGELSQLLEEYERNRVVHSTLDAFTPEYPTLDAFMPKVAAFFADYSGRVGSEVEKLKEEQRKRMEELSAKSPRIISMVPPNGAIDVDPALAVITITFDRPMMADRMALLNLGTAKSPDPAGEWSYDSTRTILRLPVKLSPDTEYGFSMNNDTYLLICDEQGNPLVPTAYRFKTRK